MKLFKSLLFACIAFASIISGCSKSGSPDPQPNDPSTVLVITRFSPANVAAGTTITINGAAFGTDADAVNIKFGNSAPVHPLSITSHA